MLVVVSVPFIATSPLCVTLPVNVPPEAGIASPTLNVLYLTTSISSPAAAPDVSVTADQLLE